MFTFAMTIVAILVYSHNVHSLDLVEVDINNILNNVDRQKQEISLVNNKNPNVDQLITLIQKLIQELSIDENKPTIYKKHTLNLDRNQYSSEDFNKSPKMVIPKVSPHLFKLHPKQIALSDQMNEEQGFYEDIRNDRNDYSKVYLILNPDSDLSSSDVKDINNLVSSLFTKTVFNKKATFKDRQKGIRRYKGFVIRDNRRRRFKDKQENFAMKSSKENDYKPNRGRGGGGGGGRTAIPYIRHRGDIYEKD